MVDITAFAPGRVNLIGDHTDTTGGLVLPMAIDLGTTVSGEPGGDRVELRSDDEEGSAVVGLDGSVPPDGPSWAAYVAGVVAEVRPTHGFGGASPRRSRWAPGSRPAPRSNWPSRSPSAPTDEPRALARLGQRAEQLASGVPCGIMDQLTSAAGVEGHALLIDCHDLTVRPVPVPDELEVVVVHSGVPRTLAGSAYAARRRECEAAEAEIGPLRLAHPGDEAGVSDPVLRRRARHVLTENARVRATAAALADGDLAGLGPLLAAGHASLRDDFEVSVPAVDDLVARLSSTDGVLGARMTGGGFGGCVVALTRPGALSEGWTVRASGGARLLSPPG